MDLKSFEVQTWRPVESYLRNSSLLIANIWKVLDLLDAYKADVGGTSKK